jgi:putative hemolysin
MMEAVGEVQGLDREAAAPHSIRFSYARPDQRWRDRLLIETIERLSGQPHLKRLYETYALNPERDENIFAAAMRLMRLTIDVDQSALDRIPRQGPIIFVSNHPFGVLDGLVLGRLATRVRPDAKVLTHSLLCQPPEARNYLLPIDFGNTDAARATTLATRRRALDWLRSGHALVVFPGGSVATSAKPWRGPALDPPWHPFVAKLIRQSGASVVPVYFGGQNSRLFHIASHTHYALRLSLLFYESARRLGTRVPVAIGAAIAADELAAFADRQDLMLELRRRTLALAHHLAEPGDPAIPDYRDAFHWPKHIRWD